MRMLWIIRNMTLLILFSNLLFLSGVSADTNKTDNQERKLTEEQWDLVKRGDQLLNMSLLQQVVYAWSSLPSWREHGIELRYPGGEEGELWVEELKDSLISLGIPSEYLFVVPGSGEADIIILKISKLEM